MIDLSLPIHPTTGLPALGFTKRGCPIWPVMGGNGEDGGGGGNGEDGAGDGGGVGDGGGAGDGADSGAKANAVDQYGNDLGYPVETGPRDMSVEQQVNYFKHQQRRKDDKLKEYGGITPEQAKQYRDAANDARRNGMGPDERALEDARTNGAATAAQEAASQWAPILAEEIVSRFVTDEQHRAAVLAGIDPMLFVKDGKFDKDALVGHLTGLSVAFGGNGSGDHQPRQWGQSGDRPPATKASDLGLAEAKRRGYLKDKE